MNFSLPSLWAPVRWLLTACSLLALLGSGTLAGATIWGLKTHDPVTGPPAMLFWLQEDTGAWAQVAAVTVNGVQVDADGLALNEGGLLFAWRCQAAGSTLLQIHPTTAVGSPVGALLAGRNIRGATFTLSGRLLVYDNTSSSLLEIDPATGVPVGDAVVIQGVLPGAAAQGGDLCQDLDGSLLFTMGNTIHRLDPLSGHLTLLYTDNTHMADGASPWNAGLALSSHALMDGSLVLLDVTGQDALYRYDSSSGFVRTSLVNNVVPSYNAGRGDLASVSAARTEITAIRVLENSAELDAWAREGTWVRVQYSPTQGPASWTDVPGTLTQVPENPSGLAGILHWNQLPAPGEQGYWRLQSSLELPR